jgi:putative peptidoglycan lipid II flippase
VSVARSSMVMASGTIISRVLGFARSVLLAATIGVTTDAADAFGVANQLPNNVYAIIVGGVLNAVLVPQILKARSHKDGGKGYIDRLLTFILTIFFAVSAITTIAAPALVHIYTSGWSSSQLALATAFAYWCLPQLFFYGLYSLLGEVLNARSAFGPFMWAPVLNNIVGLIGLGAFILMFGTDPTGARGIADWDAAKISLMAGSATAGVAAQALILLLAWKRIGLHLSFNFKWRGFGLKPALKAASWSLGMVLVTQIGGLVQTIVASGAVSGRSAGNSSVAVASVAVAFTAWLIFMLPHSVATVSIATAYFTKMSTHAHEGKTHLLKKDLADGLKAISIISTFATAALIVLAYPISRVFVGEFPATIALGNVVIALMVGLIPFSFVYMMQRAFFALEDTKSPFWFTLLQISLHIAGSITIHFTVAPEFTVVALSLLTSLTITIQATVAYRALARRIGSMKEHRVASSLSLYLVAGLTSAVSGWAMLELLGGVKANGFVVDTVVSAVLSMAIIGFVMLAVYLVALRLLKVRELEPVVARLRGIVRR